MAEVYWIKRPSHTDVFTQGYVGVTSKTATHRFKQHIIQSKSKKAQKSIVHKVINSLGADNLEVKVLCICSEEYAYELEEKLRPQEFIGWNQNVGGTKPPSQLGKPMPMETRKKISASNLLTDSPLRKLTAPANSPFKPGYKRDEDSKEKHRITMKKNGPWNNPAANKQFWSNADLFYADYILGLSITELRLKHKLSRNSLKTMCKHFLSGWVPREDSNWLATFTENT